MATQCNPLPSVIPRAWWDHRRAIVRHLPRPHGLARVILACARRVGAQDLIGHQILPPGSQPEATETLPGGIGFGLTICLQGQGLLVDEQGQEQTVTGPCLIRMSERRTPALRWLPQPAVIECLLNIDGQSGRLLHQLGFWPSGQQWAELSDPTPLLRSFADCYRLAEDPDSAPDRVLLRCLDLLSLSDAHLDDRQDQRWLAAVLADIARHRTRPLDQPALAARHGCGERHLRRRFRALCGMSPQQYRQKLIMEQACQLLRTHSVRAVADLLGYSEAAAFSRQFSRCLGFPPSQLRL